METTWPMLATPLRLCLARSHVWHVRSGQAGRGGGASAWPIRISSQPIADGSCLIILSAAPFYLQLLFIALHPRSFNNNASIGVRPTAGVVHGVSGSCPDSDPATYKRHAAKSPRPDRACFVVWPGLHHALPRAWVPSEVHEIEAKPSAQAQAQRTNKPATQRIEFESGAKWCVHSSDLDLMC
jgi:hypothetical protein